MRIALWSYLPVLAGAIPPPNLISPNSPHPVPHPGINAATLV
jgi:hypothetical protein